MQIQTIHSLDFASTFIIILRITIVINVCNPICDYNVIMDSNFGHTCNYNL